MDIGKSRKPERQKSGREENRMGRKPKWQKTARTDDIIWKETKRNGQAERNISGAADAV